LQRYWSLSAVRDAAQTTFIAMTVDLEGRVLNPYVDLLRKVTCAEGVLCDSVEELQAFPWRNPGGDLASADDVAGAFAALKAAPDAVVLSGGNSAAMHALTSIRLLPDDVDKITLARALAFESTFRGRLPAGCWETLCADAQVGAMGLVWANGPWMKFPNFMAALAREDFARWVQADNGVSSLAPGCAARECFMSPAANPGNNLVRRNAAHQKLFIAAQHVADTQGDPDLVTGWP
jgi:hypothetical protein